jgi:hypothetical protein
MFFVSATSRDKEKKKKKKKKNTSTDTSMSTAAAEDNSFLEFAKRLAHNDLRVRKETLKTLQSYLHERSETLTHDDCMKIWKGLYYTMWLSDKMIVQQSLARDLAALLHEIRHDAAAMRFVRAFFDTLQREWPLLDSHRMDKFYYLLSQVQREIFRFLARRHWSTPLATELRDALATSVLAVGGMAFAGISLALGRHFSPSMHAIARDERTDPGAALAVIAEPLFQFYALSPDKRFVDHAIESFFEPLLTAEVTEDRFGVDSLTAVAELADTLASSRNAEIHGRRRQYLYSIVSRVQAQIRDGETPAHRTDGEPEEEEADDDDDNEEEVVEEEENDENDGNDVTPTRNGVDHEHRKIDNRFNHRQAEENFDEDDEDDDNNNSNNNNHNNIVEDDDDDLDADENQAPRLQRRKDTPKKKKHQQQQQQQQQQQSTPSKATPIKKQVATPPNQSPVVITATPQKKVLARVDSEVSIDLTPKPGKKAVARLDSEVSVDMTPKPKKKARVEGVSPAEPSAAVAAELKRRVSWGAALERDFHDKEPPAKVAGMETRERKIKTHKKRTVPFLPVSARQQYAQQMEQMRQKQQQQQSRGFNLSFGNKAKQRSK